MDIFDDLFLHWFSALERRYLTNLNFSEVRRGIQALSSLYVERRERIDRGDAFTGAGKRAAFAMYFGPLHFLLVREIVRALDARLPVTATILDLGCGTGVAGAAWAAAFEPRPQVIGVDRNSWALRECRSTYQQLGIRGKTKAADIARLHIGAAENVRRERSPAASRPSPFVRGTIKPISPLQRGRAAGEAQGRQAAASRTGGRGSLTHTLPEMVIPASSAIIAAFTINELDLGSRERFRREFTRRAQDGAPVLIVEPIARKVAAWWDEWSVEWQALGGRADEWRFRVELPERLQLMDKASGLSHRELTGRSLWLPALA